MTYKVTTCMSKQGTGCLEPPQSRAPYKEPKNVVFYLNLSSTLKRFVGFSLVKKKCFYAFFCFKHLQNQI